MTKKTKEAMGIERKFVSIESGRNAGKYTITRDRHRNCWVTRGHREPAYTETETLAVASEVADEVFRRCQDPHFVPRQPGESYVWPDESEE